MAAIREFKIEQKYSKILTPNERKILPFLIKAVKLIDKIFSLQENNQFKGANLYPPSALKEDIEAAAKDNPRIFSPFTVIRWDEQGKLIAVDYHHEYAKLLSPIAQLLLQAEKICENGSFKKYLRALVVALTKGAYQDADIAWLAIKGSNLSLILGPHERYLDKLFFVKKAYQGNLGIIDSELSKKAKTVRDILYATIAQKPYRVVPPSIVDIQIQSCLFFSGFLGRALFSRQHFPSDTDTTERYGSRILGYLSSTDYKFEKLIFPIFNTVFEKGFKLSYSKELLKRGNYYYVLLSAIAQQLHRYRNSRLRLRELFPIFDEANSIASGVSQAKHLVLKGVMDQKELEATMIIQICWIFSEWVLFKKENVREDYLKGDSLTFNFLMSEGALLENEGISWPNFAKMFFEMENLATIFTRFLAEGSYFEAQEFLSKYMSLEPLKIFDQRLSSVRPL